jgi:DNA-binding protein H-NS
MAAYGITLDDLGGKAKARTRAQAQGGQAGQTGQGGKAKVAEAAQAGGGKYRNAATGETWSGRGKAPKWLAALEAAGRKREEFLVG